MQGTPPLPDDVRIEQDKAAAIADEAARAASTGTGEGREAPEPPPLPEGPEISPQALEAGIVRLATELRGADQTQPQFVGQVFGVALAPDSNGKVVGTRGELGAGTYEIAVLKLYSKAPGQHVSIAAEPGSALNCALDYRRVAEQLERAGYRGKPLPRSMDPTVGFSRDLGAMKAFVHLDVDGHDAPRCIHHVRFDLEAK